LFTPNAERRDASAGVWGREKSCLVEKKTAKGRMFDESLPSRKA